MKATSAIIGPNDDVIIPKNSFKPDWEVELGVVIGKEAARTPHPPSRAPSPSRGEGSHHVGEPQPSLLPLREKVVRRTG
jgi:hypothetical protein